MRKYNLSSIMSSAWRLYRSGTLLRYNQNAAEPLPLIPFHGLRHTSATLLISSHQDIRTVSARLGHSQTSTTLNVYAHALKEADVQSANALESMLRKQA